MCVGATPTLLDLMAMKGADGEPLRVIETIAAGNYKMFGMYLLQDKNGTMVDVLKKTTSTMVLRVSHKPSSRNG